jgi:hydroxylamine dehydrogenase
MALPATAAAPTCQTCHMRGGSHRVMTAWGFLGVRLPMPDDKQWAADRAEILKALGVLNPDGSITARFDLVKSANLARTRDEDWNAERKKMIKTCGDCHSSNFANAELANP